MGIAVIAAWFMQMSFDHVVDVIAVRNGFVSAFWTVCVAFFVTRAFMLGSAGICILAAFSQLVLINMVTMNMVQVSVMQIISVVLMLDRLMTACGAMLVLVFVVSRAAHNHLLGDRYL